MKPATSQTQLPSTAVSQKPEVVSAHAPGAPPQPCVAPQYDVLQSLHGWGDADADDATLMSAGALHAMAAPAPIRFMADRREMPALVISSSTAEFPSREPKGPLELSANIPDSTRPNRRIFSTLSK
jgi:hypothetical protein